LAQQLNTTNFKLIGKPFTILQNNRSSWEGPVAEAPTLISYGKYTYMFYSGNWFDQDKVNCKERLLCEESTLTELFFPLLPKVRRGSCAFCKWNQRALDKAEE
jgi:hypothetical protein